MKHYEKTIESKEIYQGKILKLRLDRVELPNGLTSTREIIEHPGAVAIVAITKDEKVILVKQFRKACEQELWEIPAGKLDPGEMPEDTAIRELEEETGYRAGELRKLVSFFTSPGFANELLHIFIAEDLMLTSENPDEDEFLSIDYFSWDQLRQMLHSGELMDAKTITGLLMVMSEKGGL